MNTLQSHKKMTKTERTVIRVALIEICEGLHPLPDGWTFKAILSGEYGALKVNMVGNSVEISEVDLDANSDGDEGCL